MDLYGRFSVHQPATAGAAAPSTGSKPPATIEYQRS